jgi:iron(III) transport system permease protein
VRDRRLTLIYGLAAVGLVMVAISLVGVLVGSFSSGSDVGKWTLQNYVKLFDDPALQKVCLRTLLLGLGTVGVMMCCAFPFAWLLTRTDFPWKATLLTVLTAKLAIPGFITAMAYVWLLNPSSGLINKWLGAVGDGAAAFDIYSLGWICFLQGVVLTPASVFLMLPAFYNMDSSLEEAALASGVSKTMTMRRVTLPLLAPAILAAAMFFFVVAIEILDFVGLIGIPGRIDVLSLWIYDAMHPVVGLPNFGAAGATGMILCVICGGAIILYIRFLRRSERFAMLGGKTRSLTPLELGRWKWLAALFAALWCLIAFVVPILTLVWVALVPFVQTFSAQALRSVTLGGFRDGLDYIAEPLRNTLIVMASTIVLTAASSIPICWLITRARTGFSKWIDGAVFIAPAVPTVVSGAAFQYFGISVYDWLPLYGTLWLISIAMSTRMLAYGTRTMNAASLQIHYELDEAAYASGVAPFVAFRRIFLPIMRPAIFYTAMMTGMLSARELTLPLMMTPAQKPLVSTLVYDLQGNGDYAAAAAIALYMIVLLVLIVAVARKLTGITEQGGLWAGAGSASAILSDAASLSGAETSGWHFRAPRRTPHTTMNGSRG